MPAVIPLPRVPIAGAVTLANYPAPPFVEKHFPGLTEPLLGVAGWQWLAMAAALLLALAIGFTLSRVFLLVSRLMGKRQPASWLVSFGQAIQTPLTGLLALGTFDGAVHWIDLTGRVSLFVDTLSRQLFIAGLAWLIIDASESVTDSLERSLSGQDEFQSRGIRTQLLVAHRAFSVIVVVGAVAGILSGFHAVRNIGVSLLASAGIVSVVIGIAAQKTLGNLLAGILLSVSQQIRLGDTVVLDNEFCTVEEIRLTYVVLRTWDLRRLMVPVNKFLDQTFQNWTRVRTHLLGTVELWVDFGTPLAAPRQELARLCRESKLWDQRVCSLQVTASSDKAMKLRLLVSAENASQLFDLRCEVREKMIAFFDSLAGGRAISAAQPQRRRASSSGLQPVAPASSVATPNQQLRPPGRSPPASLPLLLRCLLLRLLGGLLFHLPQSQHRAGGIAEDPEGSHARDRLILDDHLGPVVPRLGHGLLHVVDLDVGQPRRRRFGHWLHLHPGTARLGAGVDHRVGHPLGRIELPLEQLLVKRLGIRNVVGVELEVDEAVRHGFLP